MPVKTFKQYYADPDFREKHLSYIKEKVECQCGSTISRCNTGHHRKSKKHLKWVAENDKDDQIEKLKIK